MGDERGSKRRATEDSEECRRSRGNACKIPRHTSAIDHPWSFFATPAPSIDLTLAAMTRNQVQRGGRGGGRGRGRAQASAGGSQRAPLAVGGGRGAGVSKQSGGRGGGGGGGGGGRRGGRGGRRGGRGGGDKKNLDKGSLDADLDSYMLKDKVAGSKHLDVDLDDYFKNRKATKTEEAPAEPAAEAEEAVAEA